MTENEKLDLILSRLDSIESEMQGMKTEMQGMKQKIDKVSLGQLEIKKEIIMLKLIISQVDYKWYLLFLPN